MNTTSMPRTDSTLIRMLRRYAATGRPSTVNFRKLLPSLNATDRVTHLIHTYPAKLLMHIPHFFLNNTVLSEPGDTVLDPFCGSGTVLLESQLSGRPAIGVDCNPLARLIASAKTTPLSTDDLDRASRALLQRIPEDPPRDPPDVVNIRHWFYPHVIRQLQCIQHAIKATRHRATRDFFMVCFSQCVRRVSLADPRLAVPVRLREGQYPRGHSLRERTNRYLRQLRRINVLGCFTEILGVNCRRMATLYECSANLPRAAIICSDARRLSQEFSRNGHSEKRLASATAQLVITSPPYPGAQKYIRSCSLGLGWLELCRVDELRHYKSLTIGREEFSKAEWAAPLITDVPAADKVLQKVRRKSPVRAALGATYLMEMRDALREIHRVLRPGGYLVLIAANNRLGGHDFRTQYYLRYMAEEIGFEVVLRLIDAIRSRGLMTKRNSTASMITREWVLILQKGM